MTMLRLDIHGAAENSPACHAHVTRDCRAAAAIDDEVMAAWFSGDRFADSGIEPVIISTTTKRPT